jgi:REP element-mobilizing transposase RayT
MAEPLAYFLTWTTYGTWLPGDERGWVDKHESGSSRPYRPPDHRKNALAKSRMAEPPVTLTLQMRLIADRAIRETCDYRAWIIHALNVRTNHVHIAITAPHVTPGDAMGDLKAYATRALNGLGRRKHWWTEDGSKHYLNDPRSLEAAIRYVQDQDKAH